MSRLLLLAHDSFGVLSSKTANAVLRYRGEEVVAVLDRARGGQRADEVLGFGPAVPVLPSVAEALPLQPTELVIGIAPPGGGLPDLFRTEIVAALQGGVDVTSGLHVFLSEDPELTALARRQGCILRDLRKPPESPTLSSGRLRNPDFGVLLTVGTDCDVGKMSAAFELVRAARRLGRSAAFAATGQTGILLAEGGVAVDRVISDFAAGATEQLVCEVQQATGASCVVVEGQGSLGHPAYSGVTLSLLHGSRPHVLLLCHNLGRTHHSHFEEDPIPPVEQLIAAYESAASLLRPAPVAAVAVNGMGLSAVEFQRQAAELEERLGRVVADPYSSVGGGIDRLARACFDAVDAARKDASGPDPT